MCAALSVQNPSLPAPCHHAPELSRVEDGLHQWHGPATSGVYNRDRFQRSMCGIDAPNHQEIERQMGSQQPRDIAGILRSLNMPGGLAPYVENDCLKAFHGPKFCYI